MRSFAKEQAALDRYAAAQDEVVAIGLKSAKVYAGFLGYSTTVAMAAIIVVVWYGARLVIQGEMTAGDLSAFVIYAMFVGSNIGALAGVFSEVVQVGWKTLGWGFGCVWAHVRCFCT